MATKTSKRVVARSSGKVVLSSVVRYDGVGQLTIPDSLSLGDDGQLYLTRSAEGEGAKGHPQPITLKDSVAWFRVGHECCLRLVNGERFGHWLKMIEQALD